MAIVRPRVKSGTDGENTHVSDAWPTPSMEEGGICIVFATDPRKPLDNDENAVTEVYLTDDDLRHLGFQRVEEN